MGLEIPKPIRDQLLKAGYGVFGHSTVEICHWTKKALKREGTCYKNKFYGIDTHRCMEFSPAGVFCTNNCIYCWRPMEFMKKIKLDPAEVDPPEKIYRGLLEERRRLLSGFLGNPKVDKALLEEAFVPNHFAISLSGEPTLYPFLPELVRFLRSLPWTKSIFIVTNAQEPEMIRALEDRDGLPTQLYVSFTGSNPENYFEISRPIYQDYWERFVKSLKIASRQKVRRVARLTFIRGMNDSKKNLEEFADLLEKFRPHFIELKSYMHLGYSIIRLKPEHMLRHEEIRNLAQEMEDILPDYEYMDEQEESRIVVLTDWEIDRWIRSPIPNV